MGFFILGVNHKVCPVEIRENLHFGAAELQKAFAHIKQFPDISEIFILSTCNRVELYGFSEQETIPEESLLRLLEVTHEIRRNQFDSYLYRYEGREAMKHLFRVATGLDSLVVGEDEILGQMKDAFRLASEAGSIHSLLFRLLEKALKVGKDARTETKINEGAVSIPSVVVDLARKVFGSIKDRQVLVLGTGEMAVLILKCLKKEGVKSPCVISRSKEKGEMLSREFGAHWVPFDGWEKHLASADIMIASTACPHPIVQFHAVKDVIESRHHRPLFLIDISVPRNIVSEVNLLDDVHLYNIDDLKGVGDANLRMREKEVQAAEMIIDRAVTEYEVWFDQLKARPTMERFESFLNDILAKELSHLSREAGLSADQKSHFQERICAKLTQVPYVKLKEASRNGGVTRYLEAIHSLFGLDSESSGK